MDCWYKTLPGTKKRLPLFDEDGQRLRGIDNKKAAQLALARVSLATDWQPDAESPATAEEWIVAKVCSEYIQYGNWHNQQRSSRFYHLPAE